MNKLLKIYILSIFIFPCFYGLFSLATGQLIYLTMNAAISCLYIFGIKGLIDTKMKKNIYIFIILYGLLFTVYVASTLYNYNNNFIIGDFIEFLRPIIYLMTLIITYVVLNSKIWNADRNEIVYYTEKIVFYFSIFEWFKFIKAFSVLFKLWSLWPYGHINYIRMSGMTGFAYTYAWILLIVLYLNVWRNKRITLYFPYYSFLLLLTGSRTAFVALLLMYVFIFIKFKNCRKVMILCIFSIVAIVFILYMANVPVVKTSVDYIIRLCMTFLGKGEDGSYTYRNIQKNEALEIFKSSPYIGVGSNKATQTVIENFYFHHLRNWGIFGLLIYGIIIISMIIFLKKANIYSMFSIIGISLLICFSTPLFDLIRMYNILFIYIVIFMDGEVFTANRYNLNKRNSRKVGKWKRYILKNYQ